MYWNISEVLALQTESKLDMMRPLIPGRKDIFRLQITCCIYEYTIERSTFPLYLTSSLLFFLSHSAILLLLFYPLNSLSDSAVSAHFSFLISQRLHGAVKTLKHMHLTINVQASLLVGIRIWTGAHNVSVTLKWGRERILQAQQLSECPCTAYTCTYTIIHLYIIHIQSKYSCESSLCHSSVINETFNYHVNAEGNKIHLISHSVNEILWINQFQQQCCSRRYIFKLSYPWIFLCCCRAGWKKKIPGKAASENCILHAQHNQSFLALINFSPGKTASLTEPTLFEYVRTWTKA